MDPLVEDIAELAEIRIGLARRGVACRAVAEYTPLADSLVSRRSTDVCQIEHRLDELLDFCFDPEALVRFKWPRHHYYFVDPMSVARPIELRGRGPRL